MKNYEVIPICPEIMGGLPTPRVVSERLGDKVITKDGRDVTEQYVREAYECLFLAQKYECKKALYFGNIYQIIAKKRNKCNIVIK